MELQLNRFIYSILFNLPRAILDLLAAAGSIITLGWWNTSFNYYKLYNHTKWADKIAKKYSGVNKLLRK